LVPLPSCDMAKCECRYVRHEDRRGSGGDRRGIYSLQSDLYTVAGRRERRAVSCRRNTDLATEAASDFGCESIEWVS
jgi:hypothetical protein